MSERKLRRAAAKAAFQLTKQRKSDSTDHITGYPLDSFDINDPVLIAERIRIAAQQDCGSTRDPSGRRWTKGKKGRGTPILTSSE